MMKKGIIQMTGEDQEKEGTKITDVEMETGVVEAGSTGKLLNSTKHGEWIEPLILSRGKVS